ncbi:MAG: DUF192 domain-containing protein [Chloroflexota bacterium]
MIISYSWVAVSIQGKPPSPALILRVCQTFTSRLRGYLFSKPPEIERGLLFCYERESRLDAAIHMLGVPFPLGVIWLDKNQRVVDKIRALPWKIAYLPTAGSMYIIECHPHRLSDFEIGDDVQWREWQDKN